MINTKSLGEGWGQMWVIVLETSCLDDLLDQSVQRESDRSNGIVFLELDSQKLTKTSYMGWFKTSAFQFGNEHVNELVIGGSNSSVMSLQNNRHFFLYSSHGGSCSLGLSRMLVRETDQCLCQRREAIESP
jgi:hypothetical protein